MSSPNANAGYQLRIPGKIVFLGEYAVLDGAPALVAAVDRGVEVRASRGVELRIETPGSDDRFVRPALEAVGATGSFEFSAWNPVNAPFKVGLGTSASATVAAVAAGLWATHTSPRKEHILDVARRVHHLVQGSGSGIDVAASTVGGMLRYHRREATPAPALGVPWALVWSGTSAKTGPRVQQFRAWTDRAAFLRRSEALVEGFAEDPIGTMREARVCLIEMAESAGIHYRTAGLDRIARLADNVGGAAKPSGAGGGDIAVAVFPDPDAKASFCAACQAEGLPPIDVRITEPLPW